MARCVIVCCSHVILRPSPRSFPLLLYEYLRAESLIKHCTIILELRVFLFGWRLLLLMVQRVNSCGVHDNGNWLETRVVSMQVFYGRLVLYY